MSRLCLVVLLLSLVPVPTVATTSQDVRSRIKVDGDVSDFTSDEWVLDQSTIPPEPVADSRWGAGNDIGGIALTWDNFNIYLAVSAVTVSSTLMLFMDTACGGVDDLGGVGSFRRNIAFSVNSPNVMMQARGISESLELAIVDCNNPFSVVDPDEYQSIYVQNGSTDGALEIALPWELLVGFERGPGGTTVPEDGRRLRVLAVISGGGHFS